MNKIIKAFLVIVIVLFSAIAIAWTMSDFSNIEEISNVSEKVILVLAVLFVGVTAISLIPKNNK